MQPKRNVALKAAIFESGKNQRAIALRARIPEQRLSDIVYGRVTANPEERKRLARVLRKSIDSIFIDSMVAKAS